DSVICSFPRHVFLDLLQNNQDLTFNLLMFFADELYNSEVRERNMAHMNVREKTADTLCYLIKVYGADKYKTLNVCLSRQDIADFAGTTKQQVSKTLSDFKREGIIDLDVKNILILNEQKLHAQTLVHIESSYKY
ncbi:MAG: Crp/Fnr family transcriptional regulator, partial [Bacteroidota bacterium]